MWTSNMEKVALLNLRKAFFNLVQYRHSLKETVSDKNTIDWLKSYLQNTEQYVQFKGKIWHQTRNT